MDQSVWSIAISKIMNFETQLLSQDVREASAQKHLQWRVQLLWHWLAAEVQLTLAAAAVRHLAFRLSNALHSLAFRYILCLTRYFLRFDVLPLPALHFTS